MTTETMDPRRLNRYRITAGRLAIPLDIYLSNGAAGQRYCTACQKWKKRSGFLEYESTKASFTGICKVCRGGKRRPAKIEGRLWGPAQRAAAKLGMDPKDYLAKRQDGQRWCTTHKGWFDANPILESPRYQGGSIIRCRPCQLVLFKTKYQESAKRKK